MLPLAGVRVLDLSRLLPGPYATLVLADLGAEVVKLEDPCGGDYLRHLAPLGGAAPGAFLALNRNKRSLALDLKAAGGAAVLRRLVRSFDVLVESFRPGVLDRLGAGQAALRAENPRLVVCAVSGYGQDGPYRELAGHDINYCAIAGALALNGPPDAPLPFGVQPADVAGGAWVAVAGILAALHRRAATGEGGVVDVSMTDGVLGMLALPLGQAWARGAPLRRGEELLSGAAACYRTYRTRDGRFVALGALEPKFFARFCAAVGRPELAERQLEDGGRGPVQELVALFASRTREEWARLGREQDLCLTPVLEGDEPRQDPQLRARGLFGEVDAPGEGRRFPALATPVRVDGGRVPFRPAPELGADTEDVLARAGFTQGEIDELRRRAVVGAAGDPTAA
ncbi:MAG TPA: CaiB/BaiF CoA-transferase family protein [Anaeromyxobacteraceae bacterium]